MLFNLALQMAKMLIISPDLDCSEAVLTLVAMLSGQLFFGEPMKYHLTNHNQFHRFLSDHIAADKPQTPPRLHCPLAMVIT